MQGSFQKPSAHDKLRPQECLMTCMNTGATVLTLEMEKYQGILTALHMQTTICTVSALTSCW